MIGGTGKPMKQTTFSSLAWNGKKRTTRREAFLAEMEQVIPWERFTKRIEPVYPKAGAGRQPHPLERMLRIHFMQIWFNLSDPQAEDSLYDIESMRRFAGIELESDAIPDESTILRFRHLLEEHHLAEEIFADQAYWSQAHREAALKRGIRYRINRRGSEHRPLSDHQRYINQTRSRRRARGEHAFHVVKRLWGYAKVRYRGLAKNTARLLTAFALANLYMLRRRLMPA